MHNNVIIGLVVLAVFPLAIFSTLYALRLFDPGGRWRPRRYGLSAREVLCSFCGRSVRAEAVLCRHCHHRIDEIPESAVPDAAFGGAAGEKPEQSRLPHKHPTLAAAPAMAIEDLSGNQNFVWLDSAFAYMTSPAGQTAWGPAVAARAKAAEVAVVNAPNEASPLSVDSVADAAPVLDVPPDLSNPSEKTEIMVRTIGPLSEAPELAVGRVRPAAWIDARALFALKGWRLAAAAASIVIVFGGGVFLIGSSKSRVETTHLEEPTGAGGARVDNLDGYVTFDVSERTPLYTPPESTRLSVALPEFPVAPAPVTPEKPESSASVQPGPASAPPSGMVSSTSSADGAAPVSAARPLDWESSVRRAITPVPSKDLVIAVQRLIRAEGFDPGAIDGLVGPRTRRAIHAYQRDGGLPQTGEIDRDLLKKLDLADRTVRVIGPASGIATGPQRDPLVRWKK